jgi:spore coat protein H
MVFIFISCKFDESKDSINPDLTEKIDRTGLTDWDKNSHEKIEKPNYALVFDQTKVNTMEITLTKAAWDSIKIDMQAKTGAAFGSRKNQVPVSPPNNLPAPPGGGNLPPLPGGGGALDLIPGDPIWQATSVKFNGKQWYDVGFRLKGNSSLSTAWSQGVYKLPFKLQFDEFEERNKKITDQRFYGFKEFSFSPAHSDASLMRDKIVADIFREAGVPAARTAFYKIIIDFGEGPQYCGIYTMVEVIDDSMVKDQFGSEKGNIYKPESNLKTFTQTAFEKKNNEKNPDYSDVQAFITALNSPLRGTDPAAWRTNLEKTFDLDHYLKYLAINNTIVNWDTYGALAHNYYWYVPLETKKITWIPWDFNLSMTGSTATAGNQQNGGGISRNGVSLTMKEVNANSWPLIAYVAADPVYFEKYKSYVKTFKEKHFNTDLMNVRLEKEKNLLEPFIILEKSPYTFLSSPNAFNSAMRELKNHVAAREAAVVEFLK